MKKIICIIFVMLFLFSYSYAYSDIEKSHWAYNYIDDLSKRNILSGYPDGSFKPEKNMTRAEFITILMKIIEPNIDVSSSLDHWAGESIRLAKEKNILITSNYSYFEPDKDITRREICLMLYRSIPELDYIDTDKLDNKKEFNDIDINNKDEIKITAILSHLGILNGYPDKTVKLDSNSNRAEICAFINNFLRNKCMVLSLINENESLLYEDNIVVIEEANLPSELRKWRYSNDIPYATTKIKEIDIFSFNNPPLKYKDIFSQFEGSKNKYLEYRKRFGENNYVIAISFETTNNTYNYEIYGGYEFLRVNFFEEDIEIIDAFDTDEISRQLKGDANSGELIKPGESKDTSAFYVINKLPKRKIRLDRDITSLYNLEEKQTNNITSFHSLIINLESR